MIQILNSLSSSSHWYARALFYPLGMILILGDAIARGLMGLGFIALCTAAGVGVLKLYFELSLKK